MYEDESLESILVRSLTAASDRRRPTGEYAALRDDATERRYDRESKKSNGQNTAFVRKRIPTVVETKRVESFDRYIGNAARRHETDGMCAQSMPTQIVILFEWRLGDLFVPSECDAAGAERTNALIVR